MNKIDYGQGHGVGVCYAVFKKYLRFLHDRLYYRKTYVINREAVPQAGTPLIPYTSDRRIGRLCRSSGCQGWK